MNSQHQCGLGDNNNAANNQAGGVQIHQRTSGAEEEKKVFTAEEAKEATGNVSTPTLISGLLGVCVRAVSCGAGHSCAVTADGYVYTWGLGAQGQLGHGNHCLHTLSTPLLVPNAADVQGTACGIAHTVLLDRLGQLHAFGMNTNGQLGLGHREFVSDPRRVFIMVDETTSEDAKVSAGLLRRESERNLLAHLHDPIPAMSSGLVNSVSVSCGGAHSCAVSVSGDVYTVGSGQCGQLGHGNPEDANYYQRIERSPWERLGDEVAYSACGEEYTVILSRTNQVYTFGLGIVGQLARSDGN
jgi:alpha-tubulin suppressor-like RCC1 family protein